MNLHTETTFAHQFPESDTTGGTTEDLEPANETAALWQSESSGKSIGSAAARFQIRSAKTLQYRPTSQNLLENRSQTAIDSSYESNKSKSLDWRGAGSRSGYGNTAEMSSGTQNFRQSFISRADSLDRKEVNDKITSYTGENQPVSPPWRIQAYNVSGQVDRNVFPVSGSTPRVVYAMEQAGNGQSLPVRLKPRLRQGSIGDSGSLWAQVQQGESSLDQTEHRIGYWARGQVPASTEEVTGNQTIMERIKKLYGEYLPDTTTDANTKDLNITSGFDHLNSDTLNSIPHHRKSSTDSPSGILSPSGSQQRRSSYTVEKAGTFPRWFSKNEQTFFNQIEEPSMSENRNDRRDSSSDIFSKYKWSMETSSGKTIQSYLTADNEETRFPEFNSRSLERTRSTLSEPAQSRGHRLHDGMAIQSSSGTSNISNQSVKHLATTSGGMKKEIEKQEPDQLLYPLASRGAAHSETYLEEDDIFSVKTEGKKGEDVLETPQSPSSDSVKNTIHKFEALAQQNKGVLARRALSVPGQPKPVVHVRKSDSDVNLKFKKVVGNAESQGTSFISKYDASEEPKGSAYINRTSQSNPTSEQRRETYKTSIALIPTFKQLHEPKLDHQITTCDENKMRTVHHRHIHEPDFARTPRTGLPIIGAMEENARNPTFPTTVFQKSNVNSLLRQQSFPVNMDDDDDDNDDDTPTNSPNTAPPTINMQSNLGTPVRHSDTDVSTSVKSAANGTQPKAASSHSQSSASTHPVQTIYSSLRNTNNNNYDTIRRDPTTGVISMARWSSDEEDDDDDYEGTDSDEDSDSGESSVTITSNMSQSERKSFSLSLVELCIYGGVDYKPSDGSESEDDWIPSRSASLSSDISAFSSVTLLINDELDRLMDDVRNLGDDTLQKYEEVQVVVLHKEVGSGLGFTLAGGVDQNKPVTVHRVIPGGVAAQEGSVFEGDWVLSINGTPLQKCAHWEALRTLRKAKSQAMAVVVLQRGNDSETQNREEATHRSVNTGRKVYITLNKSSSDLGFSLEGGVDSSSGDKPLTVQRIFHGGPVSQVFPGDELLEIQGQSLMGMRRLEAWNLIKKLPPGPVEVVFNRPHQLH